MKETLIGRVIEEPTETKRFLRFRARFAPHEQTEVTVRNRALQEEARLVKVGDKIAIRKWASIGPNRVAANTLRRLVDVPADYRYDASLR